MTLKLPHYFIVRIIDIMKRIIFVLTILLFSANIAYSTQDSISQWTGYFGSAYSPFPWGKTIRGVGDGVFGITPRFDRRIELDLKRFIKTHDVIIGVSLPVDKKFNHSFPGNANLQIRQWRENLLRDCVKSISFIPENRTIYFQIGNEVNTRNFGKRISSWAEECPVNRANDLSSIPCLVEYYLAPAVEVLHSVRNDRRKVKIILGSMAAYFRADSMRFLDYFLNYRVQGDYAESLKGKKVYEIIDIASIQYLVTWGDGSNLQTRKDFYASVLGKGDYRDGNIWLKTLNSLYNRWIATGKLSGIWATEEIGKKKAKEGLGAVTAIKVAARYMHWWANNEMTNTQGRCIFWGVAMGTPESAGNESLQILYNYLGQTGLSEINGGVNIDASGRYEYYVFQPDNESSKRVAFLFPENEDGKVLLNDINLKSLEYNDKTETILYLFNSMGYQQMPVSLAKKNGDYRINSSKDIILTNQSAAVLFISQK